ncbi:Putative O-antigen transporter [Sulfurovum sp. enrichment culture clone C5]|uniref:Putative O-antigen transporter n=1 Tax=Sulfurovum sp. enrichment culture clone C5 TaxID=497650 RepID=A0A0S4XMJ6_9BACT|nr:Putative O-antigen transporter [Sulfurovum sp. enrichment culture clone C5]
MTNKLKPKSEFSRNVLTLMTGTTIAQAIPIAISPILTRIYSPQDFGIFALFLAIVGFFSVVSSARYEQALLVPREDEDAINIFALGFLINIFISIFLFLVVAIFHEEITNLFNNKEIGIWLWFAPLTVFFTGLFNLLTYWNNRKKHYANITKATIIKSIILALSQVAIGSIKSGAAGLIGGQILSSIFSNMRLAKALLNNKKLLKAISKESIINQAKKYTDFPKFQAPHAMLNNLSSSLPTFLFSTFFSIGIVGFYSLATRIVFAPLGILSNASAKVYNQRVSELYNNHEDAFSFTVRFLKSLAKKIILPLVVIGLFAPVIFAFVFGEEWREAGVYTQILIPWMTLNLLASTISFIPSLVGMQKKAFVLSVIQLFLVSIAFVFGIYFHNIYLALFLFCFTNSIVLLYNMSWMMRAIK